MTTFRPPEPLLERLLANRKRHRLPAHVRSLADDLAWRAMALLFPHFAPAVVCSEEAVVEELIELQETLARLARAVAPVAGGPPAKLTSRFVERLADVHSLLEEDAQAIFEGDPAATSVDEVLLTYPGFYAIAVHRIAHELHQLGLPLVPRLLTEHAHGRTGIDLHPAAKIGRRFCIDHGTGIVVGETTRIGDGVKLYQGVTLGALTVQKEQAGRKRHPTLEDEVVVYAGATILGGETVVGRGSVVAGNAFVTRSVPPGSAVARNGSVRPRGAAPELDFVI